mmetsp:Transcript_7867/g.20215  ORF Transcript_7867/g.20215 Transcript_7867/m.20215 type:complete len:158 (+) Transcript_7867:305-778(+)
MASTMLARAAILARASVRESARSAGVVRGMQKGKGKKGKKGKGDDDDGGASAQTYQTLMTPPQPRPVPKLTKEDLAARAKSVKDWARHSIRREHQWNKAMARVASVRTEALDELKSVDPKLYYACLEPDRTNWPLHFHAPTDTPPIEDYTTTEEVKL